MSAYISIEQRGSIAIIRLNRPEKLNALSCSMILALSDDVREGTRAFSAKRKPVFKGT